MHADRNTRGSDSYAPYGKCRNCGWSGKDWSFNYTNYCKKCYNKWKKAKAEERRRLKPPNENIEIAEGVVITRNVRERLKKQAHRDVPLTTKSQLADKWGGISFFISIIAFFVFMVLLIILSDIVGAAPYLFSIMMMSGLLGMLGLWVKHICKDIGENERSKQMPEIDARLEELACERKRQIDETNAFYASSEWRLVREQVIQEQGRVCKECRSRITDDFDLTVDHIKPRSKFPELALDKSNMQVLCRRCNSAKGATHNEESITD